MEWIYGYARSARYGIGRDMMSADLGNSVKDSFISFSQKLQSIKFNL
jgi:hypothetical protein